MTYRNFLKKKIRTGLKFAFGGMLIIVLQLYIFPGIFGDVVGVVGLISVAGAGIYLWKFVRCPKCRVSLDLIYLSSGFGPQSTDKTNYCSSCGIDLDMNYEH